MEERKEFFHSNDVFTQRNPTTTTRAHFFFSKPFQLAECMWEDLGYITLPPCRIGEVNQIALRVPCEGQQPLHMAEQSESSPVIELLDGRELGLSDLAHVRVNQPEALQVCQLPWAADQRCKPTTDCLVLLCSFSKVYA